MKELSLNILDIAKNSTKAKAKRIDIVVDEQTEKDLLTITIKDDGCGMDKQFLKSVLDPFTTTRTTRKVGLGLPLFKLAAQQAGGDVNISSVLSEGTQVVATFMLSSIDRMPIGDLAGTFVTLVQGNPTIRFVLECSVDGNSFVVDTNELSKVLGDVGLDNPEVLVWLNEYIAENLNEINFIN